MMDFPKKKNTDDFFNVAELHEDKITDVAQQEGAKRYFLEINWLKEINDSKMTTRQAKSTLAYVPFS